MGPSKEETRRGQIGGFQGASRFQPPSTPDKGQMAALTTLPPKPRPLEDDVDRWAAALKRAGCRPVMDGTGWRASCPGAAHENGNRKNPALAVHPGDDGKVLVKCHAGCTFDEIRHALGMDSPPPAKSVLVES